MEVGGNMRCEREGCFLFSRRFAGNVKKIQFKKASQGYFEVSPKVFRDYKNYVKLSCSIDL